MTFNFTMIDDEMTSQDMGSDEELINDEFDFQDDDKVNLDYYVGVCHTVNSGKLILGTSISIKSFFKYDLRHIHEFLEDDSTPLCIEIMELHIARDLTYNVVLKTFWLRIVQRTWRKIFQQRQKIIQIRKSVSSQMYFSINGKYPLSALYLPQYSGIIR